MRFHHSLHFPSFFIFSNFACFLHVFYMFYFSHCIISSFSLYLLICFIFLRLLCCHVCLLVRFLHPFHTCCTHILTICRIFLLCCLANAEKPDHWKEILQQLHLRNGTDFYELFYQPLTEDRIKTIIRVSWTEAIEKSVTNISELLGTDAIASASSYILLCRIHIFRIFVGKK